MGDAASIARALKGLKHATGFLCRCPVRSHGRGHGDRSPSLSICDGNDGKMLVNCFAGCDGRDILDALRARGLLDDDAPYRERRTAPRCEPAEEPPAQPDPTAIELWRAAEPIKGTLAQAYLRHRGLTVDTMPTLRFLPRSAHAYMRRVPFDAMIAAVQARDRQVIAAQLTWLDPGGSGKAKVGTPRVTIGALRDGAVRLGLAQDELGIAEGVETALAAIQISGVPCWASLGAKRMANVAIPDDVKRLRVFADADQTGQDAGASAAQEHQSRRVFIHTPKSPFGDFADVAAHIANVGAAA
jgi:putative DNA primase/helicase